MYTKAQIKTDFKKYRKPIKHSVTKAREIVMIRIKVFEMKDLKRQKKGKWEIRKVNMENLQISLDMASRRLRSISMKNIKSFSAKNQKLTSNKYVYIKLLSSRQ